MYEYLHGKAEVGYVKNNITHRRKIHTQADAVAQVSIYIEGITVGASDACSGGIQGNGVLARVELALRHIAFWYDPGDQISISGFSRGAASALILAHYLKDFGPPPILTLKDFATQLTKIDVKIPKLSEWLGHGDREIYGPEFRRPEFKPFSSPVSLLFMIDAVFKTVECDIKKHKWLLDCTALAGKVCHAIARHENRNLFDYAKLLVSHEIPRVGGLFESDKYGIVGIGHNEEGRFIKFGISDESQRNVIARVFDGSHSDIGGLYPDTLLAKDSLIWLADELGHTGAVYAGDKLQEDVNGMSNIILRQESEKWLGIVWHWLGGCTNRLADYENRRYTTDDGEPVNTYLEPIGCQWYFSNFFLVDRSEVKERLSDKILSGKIPLNGEHPPGNHVDYDFSATKPRKITLWELGMDITKHPGKMLFSYTDFNRLGRSGLENYARSIKHLEDLQRIHPSNNQITIEIEERNRSMANLCGDMESYNKSTVSERMSSSQLYLGDSTYPRDMGTDYLKEHNLKIYSEILADLRVEHEILDSDRRRKETVSP